MALISVYKVVSSVPASLDSNALYLVRTGTGFDFYVSDSTGSVAYQINSSAAGLSNIVEDTTPQLGGDLDLNGNDITGTGNISITGEIEADIHIGSLRGEIQFKAKAGEALTKGDPVYISSYDTVGNTPIVAIADANDSAKMPCFGLANESVSLNASVNVVTFGTLSGLDTSGFGLGDTLYISNTGTLTNSKPTGESSLIQNIGKVQRVDNAAGSIKVGGAGRTNDVPNLNQGNVFIGNASNQAETRGLTLDDIAETATNKHFTSGDESKLNGIESGATADQTDAEIKTAYENNANTNAFTDAEKTKLSGIAAGAEVNVNADWNAVSGDAQILNKPATITSAEQTKLGHISVTQAVDLDTMESDIATNNAKVSNATHTGDVTGSTALTISDEAVTNAKMAHVTTGTVKGRTTAGTGDVEDLDIDTTLKSALNLTSADVGLGNVQNVDTTNATNISSGTLSESRLPTINADNTTISNLEVDNLKTGVLDTDLTTVSANDDTLASAKAIKTYVDANVGTNPLNSFTQNSGQYIGTEGIRARDVGGIAMMNNAGTAGVTVADNGDVDIITKMTASEIKARNVNGLKLHDDGGTGLLVKDGGDVEVDTKLISSEIKAKDSNGLKLHDDGGTGIFIQDGGKTAINSNSTNPKHPCSVNGNLGSSVYSLTGMGVVGGLWVGNSGDNRTVGLSGGGANKLFSYDYSTNTPMNLDIQPDGNANVTICKNGGNVGINNSSPTEKLDIDGNFKLNASSQFPMVVQKNGAPTSGATAKFINDQGNHSWGVVAEFRVNGSTGSDRPSILFSQGYSNTNWTVGFGSNTDDHFRINQNSGYLSSSWGSTRFFINTSGNVGIGKTNPVRKLDVAGSIMADDWIRVGGTAGFYCQTYGGGWHMQDTTYMRVFGNKIIYTANDIRGNRFVDNQNTSRYIDASGTSELGDLVIDTDLKIRRTGFRAGSHTAMKYYTFAYPGGGNYNTVHGALEFRAPQGWDTNDLVLTLKSEGFGNNYAQVNGNLSVSGSVSKGSGSFDIAHPDPAKKDTHRLRHYFVETPSAGGNIYKYQLDCKEGENYIDLPDYFQHLNTDSLVWANPFKHFGRAWGEVVEGGKRVKIVCEQSGVYNILIFGDRKDEIAVKEFDQYGVEYKVDKNQKNIGVTLKK